MSGYRAPRLRGPWIAVAVVVGLLIAMIGFVLSLDRPAPIYYYRLTNDYAITVGTVTGPSTWTRVTSLTKMSSSIVVGVSSLTAPLAGFGDDIYELMVLLREPLGDRTVIDASSGLPILRK